MDFRGQFRQAVAPILTAELGEPAQLTPSGGGPVVSLQVKLDELNTLQGDLGGVGIESVDLVAEYRTVDYPTPQHGDGLVVDGRSFEVVGVEPDQVFTRLRLKAL